MEAMFVVCGDEEWLCWRKRDRKKELLVEEER
jgi:hypothetical protein